jgi:hypothetical protein
MSDEQKMPDLFDRVLGSLDGLPDVVRTKASVIRVVPPLGVGGAQLYVVQTYRQKDQGDTIFLEHVSESGTMRLVIPAKVATAIARQRDQLAVKVRSKAAKAVMQERKDRGEVIGFQKNRDGTTMTEPTSFWK